MSYSPEEIDAALTDARALLYHRHGDNRRDLVEIIEQLRADNERLAWRIDEGLHATQICFPEYLESERAHEAFYEAQRLCRDALKNREKADEEPADA